MTNIWPVREKSTPPRKRKRIPGTNKRVRPTSRKKPATIVSFEQRLTPSEYLNVVSAYRTAGLLTKNGSYRFAAICRTCNKRIALGDEKTSRSRASLSEEFFCQCEENFGSETAKSVLIAHGLDGQGITLAFKERLKEA